MQVLSNLVLPLHIMHQEGDGTYWHPKVVTEQSCKGVARQDASVLQSIYNMCHAALQFSSRCNLITGEQYCSHETPTQLGHLQTASLK